MVESVVIGSMSWRERPSWATDARLWSLAVAEVARTCGESDIPDGFAELGERMRLFSRAVALNASEMETAAFFQHQIQYVDPRRLPDVDQILKP